MSQLNSKRLQSPYRIQPKTNATVKSEQKRVSLSKSKKAKWKQQKEEIINQLQKLKDQIPYIQSENKQLKESLKVKDARISMLESQLKSSPVADKKYDKDDYDKQIMASQLANQQVEYQNLLQQNLEMKKKFQDELLAKTKTVLEQQNYIFKLEKLSQQHQPVNTNTNVNSRLIVPLENLEQTKYFNFR